MPWETIGWGLFGGVIAEFIGLFDLRQKAPKDWPFWFRTRSYWLISAGMVLVGASLVLAHSRSGSLTAFLAINVGASAPFAIRHIVSIAPTPPLTPPSPSSVN
jgi:hypothetical protein